MSKNLKTVTEHLWGNVFKMKDHPAMLVKNLGPAEHSIAAVGGPMHPSAAVIDVRPPVLGVSWFDYGLMVAEVSIYLSQELGVGQGDRVAILGWDSPEWMVINRAIQSVGGVTVPIYPNTGPDQVSYILKDSGATVLLADDAEQLKKVKRDMLPEGSLREVLFCDALKHVPDFTGKGRLYGEKRRPLKFREEALGALASLRQMYDADLRQWMSAEEKPEQLAELDGLSTLIYTSGSTGTPKGVMLTHRNLAATCDALTERGVDWSSQDVMLHYLPFAHVYGKANGLEICERYGVASAFCRPDELKEAMVLYKPTLLLGVPRVWNRFKDSIQAEFAKATGLRAKLIQWALTADKPGFKHWLADLLVFSTVRRKMGAEDLRMLLSGSAAIPVETIKFFNLIGLNLREGYGLTETTGGIVLNTLDDNAYGSLGKPTPGLEIRLVPTEDVKEPHTGVLWVRGDSVFKGYWNLPEKNKEAFDGDGWFNTGDIVFQDQNGFLWYRGRKSRTKKLDTGKFYSEESIQVALEGNPLISAVVPVGEGKPFVGALIFIDVAQARKIAGSKDLDLAALSTHSAVKAAVQAAVDQSHQKLEEWEAVKQWEIVPVEPTVDNGLMTPTLKVRSEEAVRRYPELVAAIYARKR